MTHTLKTFALLSISLLCACTQTAKIDKVLPDWKEGELDIHFINTARGECTYQILPDGTTFLVDASGAMMEWGDSHSDPLLPKPSGEISPGKVIVDYIRHFSPAVSEGVIDYFLLTHFHADHMGAINNYLSMHESGQFRLGSLPYIGSQLAIKQVFDRAYPDYDYPNNEIFQTYNVTNYRAFLDWSASHNGTQVARWKAGSKSQLTLKHSDCYDFSVRAYSSSGEFWTGEGENSALLYPSKEEYAQLPAKATPLENAFSNSYILSYGDFDFFLGGDLQYNHRDDYPYQDAEAPIAKMAHKVELMKANHHGTSNTNSDALMATLCPDVVVFCPWRDVHPRPSSINRILGANPDCQLFSTNIAEKNKAKLGDLLDKLNVQSGHIVVRVSKGGKSYKVYALYDTDQEYRVKAIFGPYNCK